ncbi:MAG: sulfatase-like hydrolase/transferase, partial [Opitutaceae bacterium]
MKIRLLALHLVAFGGLATTSLAAAAPQRPNLVVILADDFGYECITANGGESYQTPNVDRLAAGGMRFERCHVQPLCTRG